MRVEDILSDLTNFESDDLQFLKVSQFTTKRSIESGNKLPIPHGAIEPK